MKNDTRGMARGQARAGISAVSSKGQADRYGPAAQKGDEIEAAVMHGTRDLELVPRAPYRELVYASLSTRSDCVSSREAEGTAR